ncbi:hypothetical protein DMUE_0019 [Dictyocoela muelleri]|nr:hypothetical protein DMUE_0019 [Dictyocoela muelleri]
MGLHFKGRQEMARCNLESVKDIVDCISKVEQITLEELKVRKNQDNPNAKNPKKQHIKFNKNKQLQNKWCSYHKTATHSYEECFNQKENVKGKFNENKINHLSQTLTIKEPENTIKLPIFSGKLNNHECNILIDTGSEINYVSKRLYEVSNSKKVKT